MPILAEQPPPVVVTQEIVDAVMEAQRAACAPTTWDRFARSLVANQFPFKVPS